MSAPFAKRRVMHTPSRLQTNHFVGVKCFIEMHWRVLGGEFGRIPAPLKDDAFSMGGYCIDAHEVIPAGSTQFERFGPGPDDWVQVPTTIERSAA